MPGAAAAPSIVTIISAAVAPVVLVSASAILLGAVSTRYNSLATQFRTLTAEHRDPNTSPARKQVIIKQISLFYTRINAAWLSSLLLSVAIILFLVAIVALFFETRVSRTSVLVLWPILGGLIGMTLSLIVDAIEIAYGRQTLFTELTDCVGGPECHDQ